jgi:hypothetical protein
MAGPTATGPDGTDATSRSADIGAVRAFVGLKSGLDVAIASLVTAVRTMRTPPRQRRAAQRAEA